MSAYNPTDYLEASYIGASVYSPWRQANNMMPVGRIFGFVWDTDNNGVIVEFPDGKFLSRYFVSWSQLEAAYQGKMFKLGPDIKFVDLVPDRLFKVSVKVTRSANFPRDRKLVSIWTQYIA